MVPSIRTFLISPLINGFQKTDGRQQHSHVTFKHHWSFFPRQEDINVHKNKQNVRAFEKKFRWEYEWQVNPLFLVFLSSCHGKTTSAILMTNPHQRRSYPVSKTPVVSWSLHVQIICFLASVPSSREKYREASCTRRLNRVWWRRMLNHDLSIMVSATKAPQTTWDTQPTLHARNLSFTIFLPFVFGLDCILISAQTSNYQLNHIDMIGKNDQMKFSVNLPFLTISILGGARCRSKERSAPVLHRDRIMKPPTQIVGIWWEPINGGRKAFEWCGNSHYRSRALRYITEGPWCVCTMPSSSDGAG